jgi:hypothetical protein
VCKRAKAARAHASRAAAASAVGGHFFLLCRSLVVMTICFKKLLFARLRLCGARRFRPAVPTRLRASGCAHPPRARVTRPPLPAACALSARLLDLCFLLAVSNPRAVIQKPVRLRQRPLEARQRCCARAAARDARARVRPARRNGARCPRGCSLKHLNTPYKHERDLFYAVNPRENAPLPGNAPASRTASW